MNMRTESPRFVRKQAGSGFLYGWLLVALFIDYARPTNQLTWLEFPFFYSLVPMLLLLVTMFAPNLRPLRDIFADRLTKWVAIFLGIVLVSLALTGFKPGAVDVAQRVLGYAFLFLLIARIVTTPERLRGVVVALLVAHMYLLALNFEVLLNPSQRHYLRGGTFLGDGNDFALSLCLLFPCMIAVAMGARSRLARAVSWTGAAMIPLAIVATQSRGGTLGTVAVLVYLWYRSGRKLASMMAIAIVGALVLLYAPPEYFERMGTVSAPRSDTSAQGRIDAWSAALGMGLKNPLGIGAGGFSARWGRTAHSTYFLALGELGLPGLACVLMLVFGNLRENARLRRQVQSRPGPEPGETARRSMQLLDMLNAAMVGFAVAGAFLSATYYPHMYVLTALLIAARSLARRDTGLNPSPTKPASAHRRPACSR